MATMVNASALPRFSSAALKLKPIRSSLFSLLPSKFTCSSNLFPSGPSKKPQTTNLTVLSNWLKNGMVCSALKINNEQINVEEVDELDVDGDNHQLGLRRETLLYSFSPFPLLIVAALLPGASTVGSLFGPFVELVKSWNLPDWLVHWGHPANMAVVLFAMGGYGTYLGFRIRSSDDLEEKAKAKDLHPKLMAGMFFFFALGATGGITSLLTSDRPIFESPHAITGVVGLTLLTIQTILPALFEGNQGLRNVHGILGSGIMTLFLVHAALGLQLGLSY